MPRLSTAKVITRVIGKQLAQRKKFTAQVAKLQEKIDEIDALFSTVGIDAAALSGGKGRGAGRRGRKAGGRRRKRGSFSMSGEKSVIAYIKKHGSPTTAEINKHWTAEGRGGKANNTLTRLVQEKVLKRVDDPNVRGSRYKAA